MEKVMGTQAVIQVDGFADAKAWIYKLVRDGIARCASCDQPATHVFWQDEAEWYCLCEAHREYGQQWSGSTRWSPFEFTKTLCPDKVDAWLLTLTDAEKLLVQVEQFDATDYYALIKDDFKADARVLLLGTEEAGTFADLFHLTNGEWAYQIEYMRPSYGYSLGFKGAWATQEEALEAARKQARL